MKLIRDIQLKTIDECAAHAEKIKAMIVAKFDDALRFPVDVGEVRRIVNILRKYEYITSANFERTADETQDKGKRGSVLYRMWKTIT